MATENVREFFETLETRAAGSSKADGLTATYLFDIDGAGKWIVRLEHEERLARLDGLALGDRDADHRSRQGRRQGALLAGVAVVVRGRVRVRNRGGGGRRQVQAPTRRPRAARQATRRR